MAYQVGYWTELNALTFDDSGDEMVSTFMAMPYGEYDHPVYGKIKFNQTVAASAVQHIKNRTRGTDLDIDYDHKQYSGEAAGWVRDGEARADGLYLTVAWTKKAWEAIKNKAYRYFSPEFADEWKHPKTGQVHKNLLFGGGITNRPFLKDILPLNMSELFEEQTRQEGTEMDPKKLRKLLGLPEDATDEQVNAKLAELPDDFVIEPPSGEGEGEGEGEGTQNIIAANESGLPAEVVKLAENNPAIKALTDMVTGLQQTVQTQGVALQLAETTNVVKKLTEPVEGRQLPAGVAQSLQEVLLAAPRDLSEKIVKLFEGLNKTGYVQLGETGGAGNHSGNEGDTAGKQFNDKVSEIMEKDKLSFGDATVLASSQFPELFEAYRQSSYAFREQ